MDTIKEQMMPSEVNISVQTFQAIQNDTGMAEAIDEFNFQQNLEILKNFTSNKPMTFKTRGGDLIIDKSAKSGLMRTTPEGAPFPTDTNILFDNFEKVVKQDPQKIALFFAKQNLFEINNDKNSADELEMSDVVARKEEQNGN